VLSFEVIVRTRLDKRDICTPLHPIAASLSRLLRSHNALSEGHYHQEPFQKCALQPLPTPCWELLLLLCYANWSNFVRYLLQDFRPGRRRVLFRRPPLVIPDRLHSFDLYDASLRAWSLSYFEEPETRPKRISLISEGRRKNSGPPNRLAKILSDFR